MHDTVGDYLHAETVIHTQSSKYKLTQSLKYLGKFSYVFHFTGEEAEVCGQCRENYTQVLHFVNFFIASIDDHPIILETSSLWRMIILGDYSEFLYL